MKQKIVGRKAELLTLKKLFDSPKSEFLAVYGRRRVGKTFLIREAFEGKFSFYATALADGNLPQQLTGFSTALKQHTSGPEDITIPSDWFDAFLKLAKLLQSCPDDRKVVFIDELPWFDTPKSNFISALEYFWNSWASARKDILLIVCGSAASWMINKLIRNTRGLYGRLTERFKIEPFTLSETEQFLQYKGGKYDRYQLIQLYMVMGGIPHYLDHIDVTQSAAQNIDRLCFAPNALLNIEFDQLYRSLFDKSERHVSIIRALSAKTRGLTRSELIAGSGLPNGGNTSRLIKELAESGFIRVYTPFGKKERDSLYQLADFYSLFYLKFIANHSLTDQNPWMSGLDAPTLRAWTGYAYEQVCMAHVQQLKAALGIAGVQTTTASWTRDNAQIDLIIDRRDRVVNLCEIKFSTSEYMITKAYATTLRHKLGAFRDTTRTNKALFLTMITTFGLKKNEHAISTVQSELTMDALFD